MGKNFEYLSLNELPSNIVSMLEGFSVEFLKALLGHGEVTGLLYHSTVVITNKKSKVNTPTPSIVLKHLETDRSSAKSTNFATKVSIKDHLLNAKVLSIFKIEDRIDEVVDIIAELSNLMYQLHVHYGLVPIKGVMLKCYDSVKGNAAVSKVEEETPSEVSVAVPNFNQPELNFFNFFTKEDVLYASIQGNKSLVEITDRKTAAMTLSTISLMVTRNYKFSFNAYPDIKDEYNRIYNIVMDRFPNERDSDAVSYVEKDDVKSVFLDVGDLTTEDEINEAIFTTNGNLRSVRIDNSGTEPKWTIYGRKDKKSSLFRIHRYKNAASTTLEFTINSSIDYKTQINAIADRYITGINLTDQDLIPVVKESIKHCLHYLYTHRKTKLL